MSEFKGRHLVEFPMIPPRLAQAVPEPPVVPSNGAGRTWPAVVQQITVGVDIFGHLASIAFLSARPVWTQRRRYR
jgi:hypothetical protein